MFPDAKAYELKELAAYAPTEKPLGADPPKGSPELLPVKLCSADQRERPTYAETSPACQQKQRRKGWTRGRGRGHADCMKGMSYEEFCRAPRPETAVEAADRIALVMENSELRARITQLEIELAHSVFQVKDLRASCQSLKAKLSNTKKEPVPIHQSTLSRRVMLLRLTDGRCFYCACLLDETTITADHVYPSSKGGSSRLQNLVPACLRCNQAKGARLPTGEETQRAAHLHLKLKNEVAKTKQSRHKAGHDPYDADQPCHVVRGRIIPVSRAFGNS